MLSTAISSCICTLSYTIRFVISTSQYPGTIANSNLICWVIFRPQLIITRVVVHLWPAADLHNALYLLAFYGPSSWSAIILTIFQLTVFTSMIDRGFFVFFPSSMPLGVLLNKVDDSQHPHRILVGKRKCHKFKLFTVRVLKWQLGVFFCNRRAVENIMIINYQWLLSA